MNHKQSIFITGASSGLGAALALEHAGPGISLGLLARRKKNLQVIAKQCEAKGADVLIFEADITDQKKVTRAAADFIRKSGKIDLVYANAGIGSASQRNALGIHESMLSSESMDQLFDVNVKGVYYTINSFLPKMIEQRSGHFVVISSIAAYRPLPRSMYSASKIAVKYMADSYRMELAEFNIHFSTILMGFAKSELTDKNKFKMPFLMETKRAAQKIIYAVQKRKKNYTFPWQMKILINMMKRLPDTLIAKRAKKQL